MGTETTIRFRDRDLLRVTIPERMGTETDTKAASVIRPHVTIPERMGTETAFCLSHTPFQ